ncbi:MAG: sodium:proton antiporter [Sedimenticola sp.]
MPIQEAVLIFAGLLMSAVLLRPLADRFNVPFAGLLVIAGYIGSEVITLFDAGFEIEPGGFRNLILYILLPVLVFEASFHIDAQKMLRQLIPITILSVPMVLLNVMVSAVLIYYGIGDPAVFPWVAALLTGALLSATDPVEIMPLLKKLGVPERLTLLVDGEGIFNDATSIVFFSMIIFLIFNPQMEVTTADTVVMFLAVFFGGAFVGLMNGLVFMLISRLCKGEVLMGINTLVSAYVAYLVAESLLGVSGVMAVLVTALIMGRLIRFEFPDRRKSSFVGSLWSLFAFIADSLVFLVAGMMLSMTLLEQGGWVAVSVGIISVLIARAVGVYGFSPLISMLPKVEKLTLRDQTVVYWGGLRGAVTLALALSIPVELPYGWMVQSIAFGVVLFSVFIQAPTIPFLLKSLRINHKTSKKSAG